MPCRKSPRIDLWIQWIYVIDLDQNVFRVSHRNQLGGPEQSGTQYFRLANIPRWLFERDMVSGYEPERRAGNDIMAASEANVPAEHWAYDPRDVTVPEPALLELYQNFLVQPLPVFSVPPAAHIPTWRRLQLQLLKQFVEYFLPSFRDVSWPRKSSPFVFRQLAYAVLLFTRSTRMKFRHLDSPHQIYCRIGNRSERSQTPSWEPPNTDNYWLDGVLIVLDEYISFTNGQPTAMTKTTIAKAVQLAGTMCDTVAVIFSVHSIVVVNIHQTPQGPEVSHSKDLPLLGFGSFDKKCMKGLKKVMYATPGIVALLDLFSSRPLEPPLSARETRPWNMPNEICQQIFRCADPTTQCALERSCGVFRDIAIEYPRIGEWTLLKCSEGTGFVAFRGSTQSQYYVALGAMPQGPQGAIREYPLKGEGFEVGLWGDGAKFELNMLPLTVTER